MTNTITSIRKKLMSAFLFAVIITIMPLCVHAQARWNQTYQNYIDEYKDLAIEQMLKNKIPASITLAQGLLESAAGKSVLATRGNNHFGIKCHDWTGPSMQKDDDAPNECFRVYSSPRESYEDHSSFLKKKRYRSLFSLKITDYKGWARGLKACGYATSPTYAQQLIGIIETYKLYQYDKATSYDHFVVEHSVARRDVRISGLPHQIHQYNKNYYIRVKKGDTLRSISEELGISVKRLARYNEIDVNDIIHVNDIIYLKKKRRSASKDFKNRPHTVRAGESMYSISQFYGMRLKYLYKKNHLSPDYSPRVGDQLRVY